MQSKTNKDMKRTATAVWNGKLKEGAGHLSTKSGVLQETSYSYNSRFENGKGTNPEELIAAAHAGCFTMALSHGLGEAGYKATELNTECSIDFQDQTIKESHLKVEARVKDVTEKEFDRIIQDAKENCPVSRAINATITLEYKLNG